MTIAIYPGSFDPVTNGHLDIAIRSSSIFDKVVVGVMINPKKNHMFSIEKRVAMIKENVGSIPNIEVVGFSGLLVDYMRENNIKAIIKGLRTVTDYEAEFQMALVNRKLFNCAETFLLPTSIEYSLISSSMVKEIARFNGDISEFVPVNVAEKIKNRLA